MAGAIAHAPFLVFRNGSGQEQVVSLEGDNQRLTIGRGSATDIWLEWDPEASRVHAALERYGLEWTVVDDGLSRNGTFVNGERVHGHVRLSDGDIVRCGSTELLFVAREEGEHSGTIEPGAAATIVRPAVEAAGPTVDAAAVDLLGRTPPFSRLDRADLAGLASLTVPRRYAAGEVIFREGDLGDTCFVLRTGSVRVTRTHSDGRTIALAQLRPPALLGEMAMLGSARRSATVEAVEDTSALAVLAGDMRRLLMSRPVIAMAMLDELAARLRAADDQVAQRSFRNVPGRIAEALMTEARGEEADAVVSLTHAALADIAGTSRETVSRFLAQLERAGVLTCGRRQITIHRPAALRNYVY
ncbi:MAG TPA: cyclic nucleotide-binding domain-containing protein [Solirubrobacteraceae bacterium]|jgi:CRP/FNR family transcriptional regulator